MRKALFIKAPAAKKDQQWPFGANTRSKTAPFVAILLVHLSKSKFGYGKELALGFVLC